MTPKKKRDTYEAFLGISSITNTNINYRTSYEFNF